jgi:pimeloyl-ACP methyl ester carboxylesterase
MTVPHYPPPDELYYAVSSPPPPRRRPVGQIIVVGLLVISIIAAGSAGLWRLTDPGPRRATHPGYTAPTPVETPAPSPDVMPDRPNAPLPDVSPEGFRDPPPGEGMDRYLNQWIDWWPCAVGSVTADCADIAVPLDYNDPDGQAITLAILRRPAADGTTDHPLFVNPGGPGVAGRAMAAWFDAATLPSYQLVGWDPRGTGASTPIVCETYLDGLRGLDASPDTPEEEADLVAGWRSFDQSCAAGSGRLLQHVSTAETVADLDLLRAILGGEQLDYLGYSYGTQIGAVYADTYPERVGRMVLDSPVNITDRESVSQESGFDSAFRHFAEWCAGDETCPLGTDADAIVAATIAFTNGLDATPLAVGDRVLTQSLAADGLATFLYDDATSYPDLAETLATAEAGDGTLLLAAADNLWDRRDDGSYTNGLAAFTAIRCLDGWDEGIQAEVDAWHRFDPDASLFAFASGPDIACTVWPVRASTLDNPITADGAGPILVVGATGDSATPYAYAEWFVEQVPSAVLLTYDGPGHGTYASRSDCIDVAVEAYLNQGVLPEPGTTCT